MANPKLLVSILIICGNSLPFLWHKSFWKSVKNVCLAYCAISIGTEKCIWGECVDALTKKCTPFFQRIQSQPLKYMGHGGFHHIHAIGNTNLVSKSLDGNGNLGDYLFVTEIAPRLPIEYGINRQICIMESEKKQYKVISQRVIPLECQYRSGKRIHQRTLMYPVIRKYRYVVTHVFTALSEWIRKNSGLSIQDWEVIKRPIRGTSLETFMGFTGTKNIALTLTGEPTFYDFDNNPFYQDGVQFDRRGTSLPELTEEIIKNAREELEAAMENPEWKAFTTEILQFVNFNWKVFSKKLLTPNSKCFYD